MFTINSNAMTEYRFIEMSNSHQSRWLLFRYHLLCPLKLNKRNIFYLNPYYEKEKDRNTVVLMFFSELKSFTITNSLFHSLANGLIDNIVKHSLKYCQRILKDHLCKSNPVSFRFTLRADTFSVDCH